jgi:hypothetical protein
MAQEEWAVLADFAALPATPESRAALLAVVPLARLLELLQAGARMDLLVKCLEKMLGSEDADSRQILKSDDGSRMLPLGIGHPDELVRRTAVRVAAGLVNSDEDIAWLQEQVAFASSRTCSRHTRRQPSSACGVTLPCAHALTQLLPPRGLFSPSCARPRTPASPLPARRATLSSRR